jgi:hypothetical protein
MGFSLSLLNRGNAKIAVIFSILILKLDGIYIKVTYRIAPIFMELLCSEKSLQI